jgi:hypothetical protein
MAVIIKTRIFELCDGLYHNLSELAHAMGLSVSQVYRVREGTRRINQKFIVGAKMAFPNYGLDELFYLENENWNELVLRTTVASQYRSII